MEVLEPEYSAIHESLLGAGSYSTERVLEEVGEYLDTKTQEMRSHSGKSVKGALDGVLGEAFEPRYDSAMTYRPNEGTEVKVDEINGVFEFDEGVNRRYWVPYIEGDEVCIFTDNFEETTEGWTPVRLSYSGEDEDVPELPNNFLEEDVQLIYDAIEEYLADEWKISLFDDSISAEAPGSATVDYSSIYGQLLELRETEDSEIVERTMEEIRKISRDPDRHRKIIDGRRIYKPTDSFRLAGNVSDEGETVEITKFGHRSNFYSEQVAH